MGDMANELLPKALKSCPRSKNRPIWSHWVWPDVAKFNYFGKIRIVCAKLQDLEKYWLYHGKHFCIWASFRSCKWPIVEQTIWSHWWCVVGIRLLAFNKIGQIFGLLVLFGLATTWPDSWIIFNFWSFMKMKICPIAYFTQVWSKFCQQLNQPWKNCQRRLFCQISSHWLVTSYFLLPH